MAAALATAKIESVYFEILGEISDVETTKLAHGVGRKGAKIKRFLE